MPTLIDWSGCPLSVQQKLRPLVRMVESEEMIITPELREEARVALADVRSLSGGDPEVIRAARCVRSAALVLAGVTSLRADSHLARENCIEAVQLLAQAFRAASPRVAGQRLQATEALDPWTRPARSSPTALCIAN